MEAGGIEPPSETEFTTITTCVVHRLRSPRAGQWTAHSRTSSLLSRPLPVNATASQPEFAIPCEPPQASFPQSKARNLKVTQPVPGCCWQLCFPECFTRNSSTWARDHGCTNPVEASRPLTATIDKYSRKPSRTQAKTADETSLHRDSLTSSPPTTWPASPRADPTARATRAAATPAPKPLSTFTTVKPAAHELSIARSAATPPKLAP